MVFYFHFNCSFLFHHAWMRWGNFWRYGFSWFALIWREWNLFSDQTVGSYRSTLPICFFFVLHSGFHVTYSFFSISHVHGGVKFCLLHHNFILELQYATFDDSLKCSFDIIFTVYIIVGKYHCVLPSYSLLFLHGPKF